VNANSVIAGMKSAIQAIKEKSHGSVDYLFETQGGPPMGNYNLTSDGIEQHFATQVLSRFALNDGLASEGVLKSASVNIAAPGGKASTFDLNDVESKSSKDSNAISLMLSKAKNEGILTDAATLVRTPHLILYLLCDLSLSCAVERLCKPNIPTSVSTTSFQELSPQKLQRTKAFHSLCLSYTLFSVQSSCAQSVTLPNHTPKSQSY